MSWNRWNARSGGCRSAWTEQQNSLDIIVFLGYLLDKVKAKATISNQAPWNIRSQIMVQNGAEHSRHRKLRDSDASRSTVNRNRKAKTQRHRHCFRPLGAADLRGEKKEISAGGLAPTKPKDICGRESPPETLIAEIDSETKISSRAQSTPARVGLENRIFCHSESCASQWYHRVYRDQESAVVMSMSVTCWDHIRCGWMWDLADFSKISILSPKLNAKS